MCLRFSYTPVGTAGNADHFDVTGVQLELGNVATPFEVRPFSVELATCMRYYEKSYNYSIIPGTATTVGMTGGHCYYQTSGGVVIQTYISFKFVIAKRPGTITVIYWDVVGNINKHSQIFNGNFGNNRGAFLAGDVSESGVWYSAAGLNSDSIAIQWIAQNEL